MTVYFEKATGRFRVEVNLNGTRLRGRTDSMDEGKALEGALMERLKAQEALPVDQVKIRGLKDKMLLSEALDTALAAGLWEDLRSANDHILHIRTMIRDLSDPRLCDIGPDLFDTWGKWWKKRKVAPSTINNKLSAVSGLLKWCYQRKHIDGMPVLPWRSTKGQGNRIRWLTNEEETELLSLVSGATRAFFIVGIDTGLRRSEILNLDREKSLDGDWLRVWRTKTDKPRSIPLTDRAKEAVTLLLQPGQMPTTASLRYFWDKAKVKMGLAEDTQFVLHTLRHTTASRLVQAGVHLVTIKDFMGHSNIATTMLYAHIANPQLEGARDVLQGFSKA